MDDSTTKRCSKCDVEQPLECFTKAHWTKDGRYPSCKACKGAQGAAYRAANLEKVRQQARQSQAKHAEKHRADSKHYYAANRDRVIARTSQYQKKNPHVQMKAKRVFYVRHKDRIAAERALPENRAAAIEYSRQHYQENKADYLARVADYKAKHPEWARAHRLIAGHRWRARRRNASGSHTVAEWQALKARYSYRCLRCGKSEPEIKLTADHVIPLVHGGSDSIDNLQPLCLSCNSQKHTKTIDYR